MITSATLRLGPVPGSNLDPFLLAQSQAREEHGFIAIEYRAEQSAFDLLFLQGPEIRYAARMTPAFRFIIPADDVRRRFEEERRRTGTLIYLFTTPSECLNRFIATFYFEPFMKLGLDGLSSRLRASLVTRNVCRRSLLEFDRFDGKLPVIELFELNTPEEILSMRPIPCRGKLILYDLEANSRLLKEKSRSALPNQTHPDPPAEVHRPSSTPRASADPRSDLFESPPPRLKEEDPFVNSVRSLLGSFRRLAYDCTGKKSEQLLAAGEREISHSMPGFRTSALTTHTAPLVFDFMRASVGHASILKRSRFRSATATLLSEYYTRHHALLKDQEALARLEEAYHRLQR